MSALIRSGKANQPSLSSSLSADTVLSSQTSFKCRTRKPPSTASSVTFIPQIPCAKSCGPYRAHNPRISAVGLADIMTQFLWFTTHTRKSMLQRSSAILNSLSEQPKPTSRAARGDREGISACIADAVDKLITRAINRHRSHRHTTNL
jgi:hypothetical protein